MAIRAVLTGDIVNSTRIGKVNERKLIKSLQQVLAAHLFEFYRGDSLQIYIKEPKQALQIALLCRSAGMSIAQDEVVAISDVRISIGIGQVNTSVRTLGNAKGEAFVLSGRAFDEIVHTDTRLVISTANSLANTGLQVIADYINAIFKVMTSKQAAVIFELLKGESQQQVAAKMKKSKSTINQRVSAGRWSEIEKLLLQYENIINQIT